MKCLIIISSILIFNIFGDEQNDCFYPKKTVETINGAVQVKPFELVVLNADYSMAYAMRYVLTEKSLKIIFKGGLEGEKDSILFNSNLQPNKNLLKLSSINLDSLKEYYANPCVRDGSQVTVKITKGRKNKIIHLENYYQPDIGTAIELINSLIPEKYKIWYDKATLVRDLEKCK